MPAQSPAHPSAALLVNVDGETLLDCNDARLLTVAQARRARLALGGDIDLLTVGVSNPSWHPLCYEYPNEVKVEIARRKALARFQVVRRLLRVTRPRLTVPIGGPPCFLDPELAYLNRWIATPDVIPAPNQVQLAFREHDPEYRVHDAPPRGPLPPPQPARAHRPPLGGILVRAAHALRPRLRTPTRGRAVEGVPRPSRAR